MSNKILLTGATGFVGRRAKEFFSDAMIMPSEAVRKPKSASEFVLKNEPEIIIHTAAISDIGACERDPEGSYKANVLLPLALAEASKQLGAKLVAFSSDQVYTGCETEGPYKESDILPTPTNTYARHKLEMENRVLDICPTSVHLRATWMYDMPSYDHKNRGNFIMNSIKTLMKSEKLTGNNQFRGITYVRQVAEFLDKAATLPGGAYNYGSENPLNMYETVCAFLDAIGFGNRKEELARYVDAPKGNLWMDCSKIKAHGINFDTTAEGFARCIKDYGLHI